MTKKTTILGSLALALLALGLGFEGWQATTPWWTAFLGTFLGPILGFVTGGAIVGLVYLIPRNKIKF